MAAATRLRLKCQEHLKVKQTGVYALHFTLLCSWPFLFFELLVSAVLTHILIALMCHNKHFKESSPTSLQRQTNLSTTATKLVVVYMYRLYLFMCLAVSRE